MSASDTDRQERPFSRALLLAAMTAVLYGALLVAGFGVISLLTDTDVIHEPDAGPLVGIGYTTPALLAVFLSVIGGLAPEATRGIPTARALITGLVVWAAMIIGGGVAYAIVTARLGNVLAFAASHAVAPFTMYAAGVAFLVLLALPAIRWARSAPR